MTPARITITLDVDNVEIVDDLVAALELLLGWMPYNSLVESSIAHSPEQD